MDQNDVVIDLRDRTIQLATGAREVRLAAEAEPRSPAPAPTGRGGGATTSSIELVLDLARRLLRVPFAVVEIADDDRGVGPGWPPVAIADVRTAPSSGHGGVPDEAQVVAVAGHPVVARDGRSMGVLQVADVNPRSWTEGDLDLLARLAALVAGEIECRIRATALGEVERLIPELTEPSHAVHDVIRRLADHAQSVDDPVLGRLVTAAQAQTPDLGRATAALAAAAQRARGAVDTSRRSTDVGVRLHRALEAARVAVPDGVLDVTICTHLPLEVSGDGYLVERALRHLLTGLMHHAGGEPVVVSASCEDDLVVIQVAAVGVAVPTAELGRLAGQLRQAVDDPRTPDDAHASLHLADGQVRISHGPVTARTGAAGTRAHLRLPVIVHAPEGDAGGPRHDVSTMPVHGGPPFAVHPRADRSYVCCGAQRARSAAP